MNPARNKENAIAYYRLAYEGEPRRAVQLYAGKRYIQRNPVVEDGTAGFIAYFEKMRRDYPQKRIKFLRCVAEGNLVALHTHQVWPKNGEEDEEYATMDFFRFDRDGKIVEHWDAIQPIPRRMAHGNGML